MKIACIAQDASGGRCIERAATNGRCAEHQTAPEAPRPTQILVKFELVGAFVNEALAAGIGFFQRTEAQQTAIEAKHAADAERAGRDFQRVRGPGKRGDSGCEVFAGGVKNARAVKLTPPGLSSEELMLTDVHLMQRPSDTDKAFLVFVYKKTGERFTVSDKVAKFAARVFAANWGKGNCFENIPKPDGSVTFTANFTLGPNVGPGTNIMLAAGHFVAEN